MEDKLQRMIDDFLAVRRESNGGWAQIEQEDVNQLSDIIHELIKAKCESDADGDYPIDWRLVNRRTHESLPYLFPIRYHDGTDESLEENIDFAFANLESVMGRLNSMLKIRTYRKNEKTRNKQ